MEFTKGNETPKEMLEKIAELDYNHSQLRDMNSAMRDWLDVAEDEIAMLRSENVALRKQVNVQAQKLISEAQQVKEEPKIFPLTDDQDVKRHSEKRIQELGEESTMLKEQNKILTSELKNIHQEREQDKISLGKLQVALKTLEFEMAATQVELQHKDEDIYQKDLQVNHLEKTIEECSNIIKGLRQTNQELRETLEDRQDEALLSTLKEVTEEPERSSHPPLSILEEMKLLASSDEGEIKLPRDCHCSFRKQLLTVDVETQWIGDLELCTQEEFEAEEPHSPTADLLNERWTGTSNTTVQRAVRFLICIFILPFLVFKALVIILGDCHLFSINNVWSSAQMMLLPYCSVHYSDLPPI